MTILLAALALAVLTAGAVAQAQSEGETTQQAPDAKDKAERHCVAAAEPAGSKAASKVESQVKCFATFREAVERATGGRIKDAPNDASQVAKNKSFRDRLFAAPVQQGKRSPESEDPSPKYVCCNDTAGSGAVLSVEYEDIDFRGNTLTFRGGSGCDDSGGWEWGAPGLGGNYVRGFNDEVSSFVGANRCQVRHYEHTNYGGNYMVPRNQFASMGVWNDEASSIRWY